MHVRKSSHENWNMVEAGNFLVSPEGLGLDDAKQSGEPSRSKARKFPAREPLVIPGRLAL